MADNDADTKDPVKSGGPKPLADTPQKSKDFANAAGKDSDLAGDAQKAAEKAEAARLEADLAKLSPEERKARELEREASIAKSKAAFAERGEEAPLDTVETTKIAGNSIDPTLPAGHHHAQKFGNDPANPKPAPGTGDEYEGPMVRLSLDTPDSARPVYTECHPDMVGDYLRAGWNRA